MMSDPVRNYLAAVVDLVPARERPLRRGVIREVRAGFSAQPGRLVVDIDGVRGSVACDYLLGFNKTSTPDAPVITKDLIGRPCLVALIDDQPIVIDVIVIGDKS